MLINTKLYKTNTIAYIDLNLNLLLDPTKITLEHISKNLKEEIFIQFDKKLNSEIIIFKNINNIETVEKLLNYTSNDMKDYSHICQYLDRKIDILNINRKTININFI